MSDSWHKNYMIQDNGWGEVTVCRWSSCPTCLLINLWGKKEEENLAWSYKERVDLKSLSCPFFTFWTMRLPGTFCGFYPRWQLVCRCVPSVQWLKPVATGCIFYIYLDVRNLCGTSLGSNYLLKRFTAFCLCSGHAQDWTEVDSSILVHWITTEWLCILDICLYLCNLL